MVERLHFWLTSLVDFILKADEEFMCNIFGWAPKFRRNHILAAKKCTWTSHVDGSNLYIYQKNNAIECVDHEHK